MPCFIFLLIYVYRLLICRLKKKVIFCQEHYPREKLAFVKRADCRAAWSAPTCFSG